MRRIGQVREEVRRKIQGSLLNAVREVLPDARIRELCAEELSGMRERILVPTAMIWYWVAAGLSRERSFASVWAELWIPVASIHPEVAGWRPHDTGVLTRARQRIPEEALRKLKAEVSGQALEEQNEWGYWREKRVILWDGSTLSLEDTRELTAAFGKPSNQHGPAAFPALRLVNLVQKDTWITVGNAWGRYDAAETDLAWSAAEALRPGDVLLADRLFSGIGAMARLQKCGVDFVMRKFSTFDVTMHPRTRIGPNDWLVKVKVPSKDRKEHPGLPETIAIRVLKRTVGLGRNRKVLWLLTSLLYPEKAPAEELVALYGSRWGIEESFDELKTELHLDVLRSRTVEGVGKEIEAHLLAYNLVRLMILRAARQEGVPLKQISFVSAVRTILCVSDCMREAPAGLLTQMYHVMLKEIAGALNPHRPGRTEPRAVRRGPKPFPRLRTSRARWRDTGKLAS